MTRKGVIDNIMANYEKYGITREVVEEQVRSGEKRGFSYQTIYTGLRMALGELTGEQEVFTVSEMAEALGESEEEIVRHIEEEKARLEAAGEDTEQYFFREGEAQRFIVPPGGLSS